LIRGSVAWFIAAAPLGAQEMPNPQQMQMQVQNIVRDRPREAEAAARALLHVIAMQDDPIRVDPWLRALDSLKSAAPEVYWHEVAQLTVQFEMVQQLTRRDSARAGLVARMFGTEVQARALQRSYRAAPEERRPALRAQIETLINQHFDLEDRLRALEVADIERRLAEVRAESQRRREKRAEFVKWAVDDIVRDAMRPQ
jgi:uncharacterized protein (DUF1697 family)